MRDQAFLTVCHVNPGCTTDPLSIRHAQSAFLTPSEGWHVSCLGQEPALAADEGRPLRWPDYLQSRRPSRSVPQLCRKELNDYGSKDLSSVHLDIDAGSRSDATALVPAPAAGSPRNAACTGALSQYAATNGSVSARQKPVMNLRRPAGRAVDQCMQRRASFLSVAVGWWTRRPVPSSMTTSTLWASATAAITLSHMPAFLA